MSRVSYTRIAPGDPRDAASLNALFAAFAAADPLDDANYADEGFADFASDLVTSTAVAKTGTGTVTAGAGWVTIAPGASNLRSAGFTVPANALARVMFSIDITSATAGGLIELRLAQSVAAVVTGLEYEAYLRRAGAGTAFPGARIVWVLPPGTYDYVELQGRATVSNFTYANGHGLVQIIQKVT